MHPSIDIEKKTPSHLGNMYLKFIYF